MEKSTERSTATLRVRIATSDTHYSGQLLSGAKILEFFGDLATELLIRLDGDEGLFRAYDNVEFLAPVHAGDYLELTGRLDSVGKTSRKMSFQAYKVIELEAGAQASSARILDPAVLVARASGTCVVPLELQRGQHK